MTQGVRPEFEEAEVQPPSDDPERELREQLTREEAERQFHKLVRERDQLREDVATLGDALKKASRAWSLAKLVIAERFGHQTGNLIRQGIETQVERELGAGPPEE